MKTRKYFLVIAILFLAWSNCYSSHYMGGEISWTCLQNGNYKFTLKLYRECNGITYSTTELINVANCPSVSSITMTLVNQTDISPECNSSFQHIQCNPTPSTPNTGAVEEWLYTSDSVYPNGITLSGVPPAQGWIFSHSSCCRNPCTNILNASNYGWSLRAVMYSYNGQNANPCFDNSPTFAEKPSTIICSGYPFSFMQSAWDMDNDSLAYEWAPCLDDGSVSLAPDYTPGYSYNSPLPGPSVDPNNIAAIIDPATGAISFTSFTQGAFMTCIKVTSYKNGIKVAENYREMQIVLLSCLQNNPPKIIIPSLDSISATPLTYIDTIIAGDTISIPIILKDTGTFGNGIKQIISFSANGSQFGAGLTDENSGCTNPPCATIDYPLASSTDSVGFNLKWKTNCSQLENMQNKNFVFYFKAYDDFCSIPGIQNFIVKLVLKSNKEILPPPKINCISVNQNGDVQLQWTPPIDTSSVFNSYHIFSSNSPTGPFTEIDSLFAYNQNSYLNIGANAYGTPLYYKILTRSGCNGRILSNPSPIISPMNISFSNYQGTNLSLNWNPVSNPLPAGSFAEYEIYKKISSVWTMIGTSADTMFTDSNATIGNVFDYKIILHDSSGCFSESLIKSFATSTTTLAPSSYSITPNPFSNFITIAIFSMNSCEISLNVLDVEGKIIYTRKINLTQGPNKFDINSLMLKEGVYILQLQNENYNIMKKLVKFTK